jgi:Family of unknown function (DUF6157)
MHTTNYYSAFIAVSPDTRACVGTVPPKPDSVAGMHHAMIAGAPFALTSDDVIFGTYARRSGIADSAEARAAFFAKGQPCLRSSPLVKSYGWGIQHDAEGCVALVGMHDPAYGTIRARADLRQVAGMRSSR